MLEAVAHVLAAVEQVESVALLVVVVPGSPAVEEPVELVAAAVVDEPAVVVVAADSVEGARYWNGVIRRL